ncbi:unnamed protein product [Caretta caretta]
MAWLCSAYSDKWVASVSSCKSPFFFAEPTLNTTPNGPKESPGLNTGTVIAIGKMRVILAVLITNLFIRQVVDFAVASESLLRFLFGGFYFEETPKTTITDSPKLLLPQGLYLVCPQCSIPG